VKTSYLDSNMGYPTFCNSSFKTLACDVTIVLKFHWMSLFSNLAKVINGKCLNSNLNLNLPPSMLELDSDNFFPWGPRPLGRLPCRWFS
jgi:hypothetical protein